MARNGCVGRRESWSGWKLDKKYRVGYAERRAGEEAVEETQ